MQTPSAAKSLAKTSDRVRLRAIRAQACRKMREPLDSLVITDLTKWPLVSTLVTNKGESVKQIRKRLTYANVMSSIAVFLVLGGATAFAASKIGTSQIKANAITTGKIKKNAVTTAKIKKDAVTGAKVKESTLDQVPSAAKVNGIEVIKFDERSAGSTSEKSVFNSGGLQITFACDGAGNITVNAYTSSDHASIQSYGTSSDTNESDFNIASNPLTISSSDEQRDVVYTNESGSVVHVSYLAEELRTSGPKCILSGIAEVG